MNYSEKTCLFACENEMLLGILALPETPASIGVVVVVGGPQYRVGSHRQFVLLSRTLASAGYAVLRFDYRGMGDSEGEPRDFQSVSADIACAIDALQSQAPSLQQVVLWGLCDGASAALLYCGATQDARVHGLCLLNPWVRSTASLASVQIKHYYGQRLRQKDFWLKLVNGKVAVKALHGLLKNIQLALTGNSNAVDGEATQQPFQNQMAAAWDTFSGSIFLLLSSDDFTAKEFLECTKTNPAWVHALTHPMLLRHDLAAADHTFSSQALRSQAAALTLEMGLKILATVQD